MFTIDIDQKVIQFPHEPPLPALKYPVLHAWQHEGDWVALVFLVDRYPSLQGKVGFHHYEGATSPLTAHYEYCPLGDTVLVIPNRNRHPKFRKLARLDFPWASLNLQTHTTQTGPAETQIGEQPLTLGWL